MAARCCIVGCLLLSFLSIVYAEEPNERILVTRAAREVDLTAQVLKQSVSLTLLNEGDAPASHFLYTIDSSLRSNLAFIQATVSP